MRILLQPQHWPREARIMLLQSKRCASIARQFAPTSVVCVENGVNNTKLTAGIARGWVLAVPFSGFAVLLGTTVGREIEWLILTELLELPVRQGYRIARKDALAETILASPYIQSSVLTKTFEGIGRRARSRSEP